MPNPPKSEQGLAITNVWFRWERVAWRSDASTRYGGELTHASICSLACHTKHTCLPCHSHLLAMPLTPACHATHTCLPYHSHLLATPLTPACHATHTCLPYHSHLLATPLTPACHATHTCLPRHTHLLAMPLTPACHTTHTCLPRQGDVLVSQAGRLPHRARPPRKPWRSACGRSALNSPGASNSVATPLRGVPTKTAAHRAAATMPGPRNTEQKTKPAPPVSGGTGAAPSTRPPSAPLRAPPDTTRPPGASYENSPALQRWVFLPFYAPVPAGTEGSPH